MADVIYPRGREVRVTAMHMAIAKALYDARPFVMSSTPTTQGAAIGQSFDWDAAPSYYQIDMLELADAVVNLITAGRLLDGAQHDGIPV